MKADRKKVREELDIVHVVEWHSKFNTGDRYFLMNRRPENGMRIDMLVWVFGLILPFQGF